MKRLIITLLTVASYQSAQAAVFTDDFNRADGPLGPNWTSTNTTIIQSHEYLSTGGTTLGTYSAAGSTLGSAFSVAGDVRVLTSGSMGLAFNIHNSGMNYYTLNLVQNSDIVQITKWTDGAIAGLQWASLLPTAINTTDYYRITLNVSAPGVMNYSIMNNNGSILLYSGNFTDSASPFSAGNAGLYGGGGQQVADNFYVNTVPEPSSLALLALTAAVGIIFRRKRLRRSSV